MPDALRILKTTDENVTNALASVGEFMYRSTLNHGEVGLLVRPRSYSPKGRKEKGEGGDGRRWLKGYAPCFCITRRNRTTTLELGRTST